MRIKLRNNKTKPNKSYIRLQLKGRLTKALKRKKLIKIIKLPGNNYLNPGSSLLKSTSNTRFGKLGFQLYV